MRSPRPVASVVSTPEVPPIGARRVSSALLSAGAGGGDGGERATGAALVFASNAAAATSGPGGSGGGGGGGGGGGCVVSPLSLAVAPGPAQSPLLLPPSGHVAGGDTRSSGTAGEPGGDAQLDVISPAASPLVRHSRTPSGVAPSLPAPTRLDAAAVIDDVIRATYKSTKERVD